MDHIFPPSYSSDLPCSRKPEPNDPFACKDCLHKILDGPPNSTWDIPPDAPSLHTLPGKSLFTLYLCRLKIFIFIFYFFIDLLLPFIPRQDLVERVRHALRLLHNIQDELVAIERVLTEDNRS